MDCSSDSLEVLHSHPQNCELVQFAWHSMAHWDHGRELCDICVHLVSASLFYFTVVLPITNYSQKLENAWNCQS
jgi:hypothetical protein